MSVPTTISELINQINTYIIPNNNRDITAQEMQDILIGNANILNGVSSSYVNTKELVTSTSSSFNQRINNLSLSFNTYTASINIYTSSINNYTESINIYTSSINNYTQSINIYTSSINNYTSSINTTASFNAFTASINLYTQSLNAYTASANNAIVVTKSNLDLLIISSSLASGSKYFISDRGDRGLLFEAISSNELSRTGIRFMLCPTYYGSGSYSGSNWIGVWNISRSVNINDLTIWGGLVWKNINGTIGTNTNDYFLTASSWLMISKSSFSNGEYIQKQFGVSYDVTNDWIEYQWDNNRNLFGISYANKNLEGLPFNPVDVSDWNLPSAGRYFYDNVCVGVWNNSNGSIYNNTSKGRISNNSNRGDIYYNSNNHNGISFNSNNGSIAWNFNQGAIESNSNNGLIWNNGCRDQISGNKNNGQINGNVNAGSIINNVNNGYINNNSNIGYISSNSNIGNIYSNNNKSNIYINKNSGSIYNNNNTGVIQNNSNTGSIYANNNNGVIQNNTGIGSIYNNNLYGDILSKVLTGNLHDLTLISGSTTFVDQVFLNNLNISASFLDYFKSSSLNTGSHTLYRTLTSSYQSNFTDYVLISGSNLRAGRVIAVWTSNTSSYIESSTYDIGNTSNVTLNVEITGSNAVLNINIINTNGWTIKGTVKNI